MPGRKKRGFNSDLLLARNDWEVLFANAGIPRIFWKLDSRKVRFQQFDADGIKISATEQRQWINRFIKHPPRRRPLVALSSYPSDTGAMYFASGVAIKWLWRYQKSIAFLNLADPQEWFDDFPHAVVMHNVLGKSTPERLQKTRDTCLHFKFSFRLVVIANEKQPYNWLLKNVGLRPDMAFLVKDMRKEDLTA